MTSISTVLPTYATVNLTALAHNLSCIKRYLSPGCEVMAIVKANAYGHGAVETAQALARQDIGRFAVASLDEGIALRLAGISAPIVVLGALFEAQIADLVAHQLTPVVSDGGILPTLAKAARSHPTPYPIHLKVETGMGR
ncbi:MAG: alanine racemase, partial [Nitrospirae bacterium]|nr:alanine racemase [Nitrospirota bacterium]